MLLRDYFLNPYRGLELPSVAKKSGKNQKLWTGVYPSRIAPILMILYSFWSSWWDLSFETRFVFFVFLRDGMGEVLWRVGRGGMSNFGGFTTKNINICKPKLKISQKIRKRPNPSKRIQTHPNASARIRTHPNASERIRKLQTTCESDEHPKKCREKLQTFTNICAKSTSRRR